MKNILFVLLTSAVFTGCMTVGQPLPDKPQTEIVINKTTKSQIQDTFGNPWRTGVDNGNTTWSYLYFDYKLFGEPAMQDLQIIFNTDGTVKSYSFNSTE